MSETPRVPIVIVGTGFSGIGMAIRLKDKGIHDFVMLERAADVGGTWRDNTYPGCACDIESLLYSLSFAQIPTWSKKWSPQPEIQAYLKSCIDRFQLGSHLRLGCRVDSADWDVKLRAWVVRHSHGVVIAETLISAMGGLSEAAVPPIPGLKDFRGPLFHSASWDHGVDLAGKRVAVIGTGASAIQFVPEIQKRVGKLFVFQRTPPWVLPLPNRKHRAWERWILANVPFVQRLWRFFIYAYHEIFLGPGFRNPKRLQWLEKIARNYLTRKVLDPVLRAKLTPNYTLGCKRILFSSRYLPAMVQPNVECVTESIQKITSMGVVTEDGVEREVDVIILGTGFAVSEMHRASEIRGRDGRSLTQVWNGSPKAFLGASVPGFPNLFFLLGPNSGLGHNSVLLMVESQIEHIRKVIVYMRRRNLSVVEPRPEAQAEFISEVDLGMVGTAWTSGCKSWYLDPTGRNSALWPGSVGAFRRRVRVLRPSDYHFS